MKAVEQALITAQEQKAAAAGSQAIEWGIMVDPEYEPSRPGVRFQLIAIPPRQPHCSAVVLKDSIYVTHEGFKLWNRREKSLRRLTNWWKQEGYFQVGLRKRRWGVCAMGDQCNMARSSQMVA